MNTLLKMNYSYQRVQHIHINLCNHTHLSYEFLPPTIFFILYSLIEEIWTEIKTLLMHLFTLYIYYYFFYYCYKILGTIRQLIADPQQEQGKWGRDEVNDVSRHNQTHRKEL